VAKVTFNVICPQCKKNITLTIDDEIVKKSILDNEVVYYTLISNLVTFNLILVSFGVVYKKYLKRH